MKRASRLAVLAAGALMMLVLVACGGAGGSAVGVGSSAANVGSDAGGTSSGQAADSADVQRVSFHFGENGESTAEIDWGGSLFDVDETVYDQRIAEAAVAICAACYDKSEWGHGSGEGKNITAAYEALGVARDDIMLFSYPKSDLNYDSKKFNDVDLAFSIAHRAMRGQDGEYDVVIICLRGSNSLYDLANDLTGTLPGANDATWHGIKTYDLFVSFADDVLEGLEIYEKENSGDFSSSRQRVYLVCGHSLGGASADLVAQYLIDGETDDRVFGYTFGALNCLQHDGRDAQSSIFNVFNELDSFGPKGEGAAGLKPVSSASTWNNKIGHLMLYKHSYETGEGDGSDMPVNKFTDDRATKNHDIEGYYRAVKWGLPQDRTKAASEYAPTPAPEPVKPPAAAEKAPAQFSILGSWKSVGAQGFGQAQPGVTVTFSEDKVNFYSPSDTYRLYESDGYLMLDCTNVLWGDTLTFTVSVHDDDHMTIYTGSSATTTELERIGGSTSGGTPAGGSTNVGSTIDGLYVNFDLMLPFYYDFYDDGTVYAGFTDNDGYVLVENEGYYSIHGDTITISVDLDAALASTGLDRILGSLGIIGGFDMAFDYQGDVIYIEGMEFELLSE